MEMMIEIGLYLFTALCVLGILQTYLIYPAALILVGADKKTPPIKNNSYNIGVIIAAYNEENVIAKKIQSILDSDYPLDKINIYVGSDASTDKTNELITSFKKKHPNIHLKIFQKRSGKALIINNLASECQDEILILTDANVFFTKDTITHLVRHFSNSKTKQVCAKIIKTSAQDVQIQGLEKKYIHLENLIKLKESNTWGFVIGAEGGCYAIRRENYTPVPKNFFMDDFFITMSVIKNKGEVLFDDEAIVYEDLPVESAEEFKRKIRISIGNFQNLIAFKSLLWPFWSPVSFAFLSHKILRWLTPFLLIGAFICSLALIFYNIWFSYLCVLQAVLFLTPSMIPVVKKIKPVLFVAHFYNMNLALLIGFFKYLNGVKSSVWQPTQRLKN
ncbi:MAG: glycosyltransferase [Bacteroidetes bacterium]|nr:glycosyltransferase [Bacteroidota bacterium]